jgi:hypothetical protein
MKKLICIWLLFTSASIKAQDSLYIKFVPIFNQFQVEPSQTYPYLKDSISFQSLKFYIGHIQFFKGEVLVASAPETHYLLNFEESTSQLIGLANKKTFDRISFELGVDSATTVSGALSGALDPSLGMYWTWQSGYIHAKIEATLYSKEAQKTELILHLGGYKHPFNTLQKLQLSLVQTDTLSIGIDLTNLISSALALPQKQVMSPKPEALMLSKQLANAFKILAK